jgi:hypothetical protein
MRIRTNIQYTAGVDVFEGGYRIVLIHEDDNDKHLVYRHTIPNPEQKGSFCPTAHILEMETQLVTLDFFQAMNYTVLLISASHSKSHAVYAVDQSSFTRDLGLKSSQQLGPYLRLCLGRKLKKQYYRAIGHAFIGMKRSADDGMHWMAEDPITEERVYATA